jgi:hypothetical protein
VGVTVSHYDLIEVGHAADDFVNCDAPTLAVFVRTDGEILLLPIDAPTAVLSRSVNLVEFDSFVNGDGPSGGHRFNGSPSVVALRRQALRWLTPAGAGGLMRARQVRAASVPE